MTRVFKTLLLCLLMALLPLGGLASASTGCGRAHPVHEHHGQHETAQDAHDPCAAAHDTEPSDTDSTAGCAVCHAGAVAPVMSLLQAPLLAVSGTAGPFPTASFAEHIPPGLERPPRLFGMIRA